MRGFSRFLAVLPCQIGVCDPPGGDPYTVGSIAWYEGGSVEEPGEMMAPSDVFKPGKTYILELVFNAAEGNIFKVNASISVNGITDGDKFNSAQGPRYRVAFTTPVVQIDSASVTIPAPTAGEKAATSADVILGSDAYELRLIRWWNSGTAEFPETSMLADDVFVAGRTYVVEVYLQPAEGYVFASDAVLSINGITGGFTSKDYLGNPGLRVEMVASNAKIKTASAIVPAPVEGDTPATAADVVLGSDMYTAKLVRWFDGGTPSSPGPQMAAGSVFDEYETYIVEIIFEPKAGYEFASTLSCSINGITGGFLFHDLNGNPLYRVALDSTEAEIWTTFPDVKAAVEKAGGPDKVWYVRDGWLNYVVENHLMGGYTGGANKGNFGPYDNITRGQVATILYRAVCEENAEMEAYYGSTYDPAEYAKTSAFKDMKPGKYYTAAVNWAKDVGIMTGDGATGYTTVRPDDPVSREELCVMLDRLVNGVASKDANLDAAHASLGIKGMSKVSSWAKGSVNWAVNNDIISGVNNANGTTTMNPQDNTWRASAAKMLTVTMRDVIPAL